MSPVSQGFFKGMAVVFDDQVHNPDGGDEIHTILKAIKDAGGHTVNLASLPEEDADLDNFSNAAFFIMDWNFIDGAAGVLIPEDLRREQVQNNIAFLKRLSKCRHAPVFIFTNDSPEAIESILGEDTELYRGPNASHIIVRQKREVGDQVYRVLDEWAREAPSIITLKTWERQLVKATNALFMDFHDKESYWPVLLWQTFDEDHISPSDELGRLISRLVMSRMKPLEVDLSSFVESVESIHQTDPARYRQALLKVLEGERFLEDARLDPQNPSTGDLFSWEEGGSQIYRLNVRAECDCVNRSGSSGELYLLKGTVVENAHAQINPTIGKIPEKDNEAIIFALRDGLTIKFHFKDLFKKTWTEMKDRRIGRLLPPFLTHVLQRFAAYSHRPGLPRIPRVLSENPVAPPPHVHPG